MRKIQSAVAVVAIALSAAACVQANPPGLDYGTIIDAHAADMSAENSGAGGLLGAGAGGAIGSRFGSGGGNVAATAAGIVVGAVVGAELENASLSSKGAQYTIRLDDGRIVTIVQHLKKDEGIMALGTRVVIRTVGRDQRVQPAS